MMPTLLITILAIACILIVFALYGALMMGGTADDHAALSFGRVGVSCVDAALVFAPHFVRIEPDTAPVVSDEALHHWGEVYTANPQISRRGVRFDSFIRAPETLLQAVAYEPRAEISEDDAIEPASCAEDDPPIPARDAFALDTTTCDDIHPARLAAEAETQLARDAFGARLRYRDGAYVEPLHHRRLHPHPETRPHRPWRLTGAR